VNGKVFKFGGRGQYFSKKTRKNCETKNKKKGISKN
jgi:hypothetical protein